MKKEILSRCLWLGWMMRINNSRSGKELCAAIVFASSSFFSSLAIEPAAYISMNPKGDFEATAYHKTGASLCRYLAFRDIPMLLARYCRGQIAFDFGVGTGLSAQFLIDHGFAVAAGDMSEQMLEQAARALPHISLYRVKDNCVALPSHSFDLVLSSFVLFEMGTKLELLSYFREAKRLLKKEGIFVAITGSEQMFCKDWLIIDANFPQNRALKSGDQAQSSIRDIDLTFIDFYWTEKDYRDLLATAGFKILALHYPKGLACEPYAWRDERYFSPYLIIVAQPILD